MLKKHIILFVLFVITAIACLSGCTGQSSQKNAQFDEASEFTGGLAKARVGKKDGYIDRSGVFVWPHAKQQ